jgi:hypothetical protein
MARYPVPITTGKGTIAMSFLKTLTFTSVNELTPSHLEQKRFKLISKLKEQVSLLENPNLTVSRKRWTMVDGEKVLEQKTVPVRPWWKQTLDGKVVIVIRSGLKKIEFEKGKSAIVLPDPEELPKVLKGLIDAVSTGELDHFLETKASIAAVPKRRVG